MATAPIYCTHKELKRVFPQLDEFDTKVQVFGWTTVSTNKYASHNSGLVSQLFADGEDLGAAQSAHTDLNVEGEWFYNSAEDVLYYYSASTPADKLIEAGEEFTAMVTQFRTDASRYLDSKLDPNLPANQFKDKSGNFDYMIIRTTALLCAALMIRATDPTSEMASAFMAEAQENVDALNNGKAGLSWQNTTDPSKGVVRDVTDEIINGDYQALTGSLQIRFSGTDFSSTAALNDTWEVEVQGWSEEVDVNSLKPIRMTRRY